jgi:hypothetical protein
MDRANHLASAACRQMFAVATVDELISRKRRAVLRGYQRDHVVKPLIELLAQWLIRRKNCTPGVRVRVPAVDSLIAGLLHSHWTETAVFIFW